MSTEAAASAIDAANADDPSTVVVDGVGRPLAQVHGELAVRWLQRLDPDPSDAQLLAARAHHLRRWESPRGDYPEGRAGYLRWRTAAKKRHADDVAGILVANGIDAEVVAQVQQLVRKEGPAGDPAQQAHEDAVCLAFLDTQLDGIVEQLGEAKAIEVLVKTAGKMSPAALALAAEADLSVDGRRLLRTALGTGA